jgi:RNA polymerase sigma-70 factor (ECF subfamily)
MDSPAHDDFATTQWSLVLHAGLSGEQGRVALAELCRRYWYPLYAYARRRTGDPTQAQDCTQEFFARLLEKDLLALATPQRGRFRSFLLVALKHFLLDQRKKSAAEKRGGGHAILPLDFESGESKFRLEPSHSDTPEKLFEREWTLQLLANVMQRLREEYMAADKARQFEVLQPLIAGARDDATHAQAAAALETSEENARQLASRLRKRYRELLRLEVSHTVAEPGEVDDELRGLLRTLE